jgi:hypothetical protein
MPSLFEARCRLPTSANCVYFDVRARTRALRSSLGRWPRPPSGSDSDAPSPLRERIRAASRAASGLDDPVAGSSHLRGFARPRYRPARATTERVAPPVCSDDRRARVRGPREGLRLPGAQVAFSDCPCVRCVRLERSHANEVPLLGVLRTSAVAGACAHKRGSSCRRRGPTEARIPPAPREGNRLPANRDAFHRHAPPSVHRVAPARGTKTTSRSRRPTRFPQAGER